MIESNYCKACDEKTICYITTNMYECTVCGTKGFL